MTVLKRLFAVRRSFLLYLSIYLVGLYGIFIIASALLAQLEIHRGVTGVVVDVDADILAGISLVYLWWLLRRRKHNAWLVTVGAYIFILGFNLSSVLMHHGLTNEWWLLLLKRIIVPLCVLGPLLYFRTSFTVRSDIKSFTQAVRVSLVLLGVAFLFGVIGFTVLDTADFHEEISLPVATQRTIDQFDLTTSHPLVPHTRRAQVFMDSLSIISVGSLAFVFVSFFQPLKARYGHIKHDRDAAEALIHKYPSDSEDFFKLWPHDKSYLFSRDKRAGLAYRVERGVALVVGDPFGDPTVYDEILSEFNDLCYTNDWLPAFVHVRPQMLETFAQYGYNSQLIGQEAIVDLSLFREQTRRSKYFRNIINRFEKQSYDFERLLPPHSPAVVQRLQVISDEWLARPGRTERGLVMGHFTADYLQMCAVIVARDAAGTIQGFLNQVPTYETKTANFDMLRHASTAAGNINDFLLCSYIDVAVADSFTHLNLGLSPLAGLDAIEDTSLIGTAMRLLYKGGDRLYSFQGLRKFKAKYEPEWSDRYIVYTGGVTGFARTVRALNRAMNHLG